MFRLFFGGIKYIITCFQDLLTFTYYINESAKIVYKDLKIVKQISGPDLGRFIQDVEGGTIWQRRHFQVKYFATFDN